MARKARANPTPPEALAGPAAASADGAAPVADERLLDLYRAMRMVREVELRIESLHKRGRMAGSFHSSLGQEACAVGVCSALRAGDLVTSTHRGHGHAIAKGVPIDGIVAELFGRGGGVSGGRGGSMHLHHRASGFLGENAIVAGGLPWAAGAAWARRRLGRDDVAVAFIGDGGIAQGVFHETLILARHWSSPCLIACENNGLAHSMPAERLFGAPGEIARQVEATGIESRFVDGRDVAAVSTVANELVEIVRTGRPAFLECQVFRVRPHSISDPDYRYRPKGAGEEWMASNDPLVIARSRLESDFGPRLDDIDATIVSLVDEAVVAAEAEPPASQAAATSFVYTSDDLQGRA